MIRGELLDRLANLGMSQREFAFLTGHSRWTIYKLGVKTMHTPLWVEAMLDLLEMYNTTKKIINSLPDINEPKDPYSPVTVRHGNLICSFCGSVVERNIYSAKE